MGRTSFAALSLVVVSCAAMPPPAASTPAPSAAAPAPLSTQVFFYPRSGQSPEQQSRDRYECYLWAVKESGFDPSQRALAPHQKVRVVAQPAPGRDTAVGAIAGATIGAAVAAPHDATAGAVVGAVTGGAIGAISDNQRAIETQQAQRQYDRRDAERSAQLEQQVGSYRRAMSACLEGRGYAVD